ncbi:IS3 family transposase [Dactylosporangium sp. NBC_01737]|nr:IS3 family transposase [Dactylosporangium sp. NBC_01737]
MHGEHKGSYGSPRVTDELRRRGRRVNRKRVERIMRERHIVGITRRRRRTLTRQDSTAAPAPDLIGRDFTSPAPGHRLVGDITYLPTQEGWLYLATTIDLFNREVVGYAMAEHTRADLVCDAVELAHRRGLVKPQAIFHSDRGSVHLGRVPHHAQDAPHERVDGPRRIVLRQRRRRVVLRDPESRDRHPSLGHPGRGTPSRVRVPCLLQPQPSTFDTQPSHPVRGPRLLPSGHRPRGMKPRCPILGVELHSSLWR